MFDRVLKRFWAQLTVLVEFIARNVRANINEMRDRCPEKHKEPTIC